jgi:histone H3/H4
MEHPLQDMHVDEEAEHHEAIDEAIHAIYNEAIHEQEKPKKTAVLPKAALRRLAADVGCKFKAGSYEAVVNDMEHFVHKVVAQACKAGSCARKQGIGRQQVEYGMLASGHILPPELAKLTDADLRRMRRCNTKAPPQTRRPSALSTEISEGTFARVLRRLALEQQGRPVRFSGPARRLLHVACEERATKVLTESVLILQPPLPPGLRRVLLTSGATDPEEAMLAFDRLCLNLDALLSFTASTTVTHKLLLTAMHGAGIPEVTSGASEAMKLSVQKVLRGQLPDRRLCKNTSEVLAHSISALAGIRK